MSTVQPNSLFKIHAASFVSFCRHY